MQENDIFKNLFILEMANNHLGKLDRGLHKKQWLKDVSQNTAGH